MKTKKIKLLRTVLSAGIALSAIIFFSMNAVAQCDPDVELPVADCYTSNIIINNSAGQCYGTVVFPSTMVLQYDPTGFQAAGIPLPPASVASGYSATSLLQHGMELGWISDNVLSVGRISSSPTIVLGDYLEFAVTVPAGTDFARLQYSKLAPAGSGGTFASIRSSLDGFASDISILNINSSGFEELIFNLSGMPFASGSVTFRIYFWGAPTNLTDWDNLVSTTSHHTGGNGLRLYTYQIAGFSDNCGIASVNYSGFSSNYQYPAGTTTVTGTATDINGNTASCSFTVTVPQNPFTVNAGNNETTFFGFSQDQTLSRTATVSGGVEPYTYQWTMNRALMCNMVNTSGDEIFSTGSCTFNSCPSSPLNTSLGSPPVCNGSASVTVKLIADAVLTVTVTDANGCTATSSFTIYSEDARCFSGNSNVQKVIICHRHNNSWSKMCVNEDAVADHLSHGDYVGNCTSNREEEIITEESSSMFTAYPNPFNGKTTIAFSVPHDANAVVRVFDAMGRQVSVVFDGIAKSGTLNKVEFDGENFSSGIYFYSIASDGINEVKRMELVK
jgi:hypothetical protein